MLRRFAGIAFVLAWPALASGETFRVPEDHGAIQEAIDLTSPSQVDTVSLAPGYYFERLDIRHALVLRGRSGAAATTIDGGASGDVVTLVGVGRNCILEDLTITGGKSTDPKVIGAAIYLNQYASPTVQRCRLVGNNARVGGGLYAYVYCEPLVRDCWIAGNVGGGVGVELADPDGHTYAEFENTIIADNRGFGIVVHKGARVWVRNCTITHNDADGVRTREYARMRINNTLITHNGGGGILREDITACFVLLQCNDVYANAAGNYLGTHPQDACFSGRGSGDVSIDPCYQDADNANYHLEPSSPLCTLRQPGSCGVLGAYPDPCSGPISNCTTSIEAADWGTVKQLFRD